MHRIRRVTLRPENSNDCPNGVRDMRVIDIVHSAGPFAGAAGLAPGVADAPSQATSFASFSTSVLSTNTFTIAPMVNATHRTNTAS